MFEKLEPYVLEVPENLTDEKKALGYWQEDTFRMSFFASIFPPRLITAVGLSVVTQLIYLNLQCDFIDGLYVSHSIYPPVQKRLSIFNFFLPTLFGFHVLEDE